MSELRGSTAKCTDHIRTNPAIMVWIGCGPCDSFDRLSRWSIRTSERSLNWCLWIQLRIVSPTIETLNNISQDESHPYLKKSPRLTTSQWTIDKINGWKTCVDCSFVIMKEIVQLRQTISDWKSRHLLEPLADEKDKAVRVYCGNFCLQRLTCWIYRGQI